VNRGGGVDSDEGMDVKAGLLLGFLLGEEYLFSWQPFFIYLHFGVCETNFFSLLTFLDLAKNVAKVGVFWPLL